MAGMPRSNCCASLHYLGVTHGQYLTLWEIATRTSMTTSSCPFQRRIHITVFLSQIIISFSKGSSSWMNKRGSHVSVSEGEVSSNNNGWIYPTWVQFPSDWVADKYLLSRCQSDVFSTVVKLLLLFCWFHCVGCYKFSQLKKLLLQLITIARMIRHCWSILCGGSLGKEGCIQRGYHVVKGWWCNVLWCSKCLITAGGVLPTPPSCVCMCIEGLTMPYSCVQQGRLPLDGKELYGFWRS